MSWVIDASVAIKFLVDEGEDDAQAVRALLETGEPMIAPELLLAEVLNVLWKKRRLGEVGEEQGQEIQRNLHRFFAKLEPLSDLADSAWTISQELDHSMYDAFFLALAEAGKAILISADERLLKATRGTRLEPLVRPLHSFLQSDLRGASPQS